MQVGSLGIPDDSAGAPVEAALLLQEREREKVREVIAPTPMIYYPNANAMKIRPTPAKLTTFDRVVFALPKNSAIGFPDLAIPGLVIKAVAGSGNDAITLAATAPGA